MSERKSHTILNVDDNEPARYAKGRVLARAGYRVLEAGTGEAALRMVRQCRPELVLLDVKLPDINGLEVCRQIKGDPATADIMVAQISASRVSMADRVQGLDTGADAYLTEPLEAEEMLAMTRALLRLHDRETENRQLLAQLRESEAEFRASFEISSAGMCQADPFTGRLLRVNRRLCEMLGYEEAELLGLSFADFTHPDEKAQSADDLRRLARGEVGGIRTETRYLRKDGETLWADVTVNLIHDSERKPVRTLAVVLDITERKKGQRERARLAAIVDSTQDAIIGIHLDGTVMSWNRGAEKLYGYGAAEILGLPVSILTPSERPEENELFARVARGEAIEHYDTVRRRKDGSHVDVVLTISPIRNMRGEIIGVSKIARDISERKQSELVRARLAALVEHTMTAIVGLTPEGIIESWNPAAERLFGYAAAQAVGRPIALLAPAEKMKDEEALWERLRAGEAQTLETTRHAQGGRLLHVILTLAPVRDGRGKIVGASASFTDVTARKLAEQSLWRSEEQLSLAQAAAHAGIWDWDRRTGVLSWTSETLKLYGVASVPETYADWRKLVHADDIERIEAELEEALRRRQPFSLEYRVTRGAEARWIALRGQGYYDERGEAERVLAINMDIHEHKLAEDRVRESEERFKALADNAPVLIWIGGPDGARFFNQAYRDFVGVETDAELFQLGWQRFVHAEDVDRYMEEYARAAERRAGFEFDFRLRRADGQYRWMKTVAKPRFIDNTFVGYAGCTLDIHDHKIAEAQLALLAAVVNSSQDAIYSFTLDAKILSWNSAAERLFGWSEAEVLGRPATLLASPELAADLARLFAMVQRGERVHQYDTVGVRKDGSRFDAILTLSPVMAQGGIVGISAITRDITERKRVREQRDQQARLLDLSLDAIIVRSAGTGVVEYWNEGAEKLYGYSAGEAIGRSIDELLKPMFPLPRADIEAKLQSGGDWDGRVMHVQKTGGQVAVLCRMQKISRPGGDVVLEVNRDITAVEEAEHATMEAAARLKAIVETAVDGIITLDEGGVIESVNPAAEKIFGYEAAEMTGMAIGALIPELDGGEGGLVDRLRAGERQTNGSSAEIRGRRKDGSELPLEFGFSETVLGGRRFFTGLVRDASARKRAEQALIDAKDAADAANRAKSEFLANVSHEIRNPMTGIMGYADILLSRLTQPKDIEYVRTIKDSGQYLLQIINDLLDLAKIEAQGLELVREEIHLPSFLADVYTLMEGAARAKSLPLTLKYDGIVPQKIEGDSKRLRQILINLLSNAIKFTHEGGAELIVRYDAEKQQLHVKVADSGIGMTEEQQQRLFTPFTQGDSSVTKSYGGTGLGLAITSRLVEALGGRISVTSLLGIGSTFVVTLPVRVLAGSVYRDMEALSNVPGPGRPQILGTRVMIVEDQPDIRRLMEYFVSEAGGKVVGVESGEAALQAIGQSPEDFDVVLMDIQMPRLDGYETTRRLRARGFAKPIIAVTAGAMPEDRVKCIGAGCTDYGIDIDPRKITGAVRD